MYTEYKNLFKTINYQAVILCVGISEFPVTFCAVALCVDIVTFCLKKWHFVSISDILCLKWYFVSEVTFCVVTTSRLWIFYSCFHQHENYAEIRGQLRVWFLYIFMNDIYYYYYTGYPGFVITAGDCWKSWSRYYI